MSEIVVAKASKGMVGVAAAVYLAMFGAGLVFGSWPVRVGVLVVGAAMLYRLTRVRVAVAGDQVKVVNYTRSYSLPISGTRVVEGPADPVWMSDLGAMDRDGRLLYLTDGARMVHVGVAPVHGTRRAEVSASLESAMAHAHATA